MSAYESALIGLFERPPARGPREPLPVPGLVATYQGRDCLLMPLFPGETTSIDLGPYTLTITAPGTPASAPSEEQR